MKSHRWILVLALCAAVPVAVPVVAQRSGAPGRGGPPASKSAAKPDTTKKVEAFALDFQNQELQVVLNALAEAGNLNVTMTNIPSQRVTVRMGRSASRDTLVAMIRGLSESNGVKFTEAGSLVRLEGDANASPTRQQAAQTAAQIAAQTAAQQANQLRLFTYRLKHASASVVAPVLMNLLGAGGGGTNIGGGLTVLPNGGIQFNGGAAAPGGGGRGGGGGGAGGAAIIGEPITITSQGAGRGAVQGGGGGGGGVAAQLLQGLIGGAGAQQAGLGTLSNAAAQVRIVADESTNALLIRATTADYQLLQGIVQQIDLRPLQVLIEVTIAEVSRSKNLDVGMGGTATRKGATNNAKRDTVAMLPATPSARDFIFQLTGGNGSISYLAAMNALRSRGDVKVLSLPVIIAQNNKEAKLNVGEQRPFVQVNQSVTTGTVPTTVQTVQYINVGTTLTITPTINPDGYVNMAVDQTNDAATNEVQFSAPVISKRQATTQIFLRDGQTTVIGGLAGTNKSKNTSGIPILSRIPWIGGWLFGNTTETETMNELFLFLTPHIISSDEDIDRFKNSLQGANELLKDMPVGPRIAPGDSVKKPPVDTVRRRPPEARKH